MIIIFSPFFLIGNLLHKDTKRQGWVSADEFVAAPPTAVGVRGFWGEEGPCESSLLKVTSRDPADPVLTH